MSLAVILIIWVGVLLGARIKQQAARQMKFSLVTAFALLAVAVALVSGGSALDPESPAPSPTSEGQKKHLITPKVVVGKVSVIFSIIGAFYFSIPIVSFELTPDWKKVFFDCFNPFSLWLDGIHCICVLFISHFMMENPKERVDVTVIEYGGLVASLYCLYHYVTLKLLEVDLITSQTAKTHIKAIITTFAIVTSVLLLQIDWEWHMPSTPHHWVWTGIMKYLTMFVTFIAIVSDVAQIAQSLFYRLMVTAPIDRDEPFLVKLKLAAAMCAASSDGFDTLVGVWIKQYQNNVFSKCFLVISVSAAICGCALFIGRLVGSVPLHMARDIGKIIWAVTRAEMKKGALVIRARLKEMKAKASARIRARVVRMFKHRFKWDKQAQGILPQVRRSSNV